MEKHQVAICMDLFYLLKHIVPVHYFTLIANQCARFLAFVVILCGK